MIKKFFTPLVLVLCVVNQNILSMEDRKNARLEESLKRLRELMPEFAEIEKRSEEETEKEERELQSKLENCQNTASKMKELIDSRFLETEIETEVLDIESLQKLITESNDGSLEVQCMNLFYTMQYYGNHDALLVALQKLMINKVEAINKEPYKHELCPMLAKAFGYFNKEENPEISSLLGSLEFGRFPSITSQSNAMAALDVFGKLRKDTDQEGSTDENKLEKTDQDDELVANYRAILVPVIFAKWSNQTDPLWSVGKKVTGASIFTNPEFTKTGEIAEIYYYRLQYKNLTFPIRLHITANPKKITLSQSAKPGFITDQIGTENPIWAHYRLAHK